MADDDAENIRRKMDITPEKRDDTAMIDLIADNMSKAYTFLKSRNCAVLRSV